MTIARGRLLAAAELTGNVEAVELPTVPRLDRGRLVPKAVLDASEQAEAIRRKAEQDARAIVERAERSVAEVRLRAEAEARAEGTAKLAAQALALKAREARSDEHTLDRSVELARLLAERLLGESLRVAPEQVAALARQALLEARGARRVTIVAHPDDAALLETRLGALGFDASSTQVVADAARGRGSLRIETDVGVLDAELAPQLERLARKLREALANERR